MIESTLEFYVGWDVGGWNCDKNQKSRDAIVILDDTLRIVGKPKRGNLRQAINASTNTREWIASLFRFCGTESPGPAQVTMAIDTPLGFSDAFRDLADNLRSVEAVEKSHTNPYLFRYTERYLFERGLKPLSAIKDMIGSQATKGMHALAKFTPKIESCGVWADHNGTLRALESYPSGSRGAPIIRSLLKGHRTLGHPDLNDARVCALIAYLFASRRSEQYQYFF